MNCPGIQSNTKKSAADKKKIRPCEYSMTLTITTMKAKPMKYTTEKQISKL